MNIDVILENEISAFSSPDKLEIEKNKFFELFNLQFPKSKIYG